MKVSTALLATVACAAALAAQTEKASTGLAMQKARADGLIAKGKKAYYPADQWDLSDLPAYVPKGKVSGTIRLWGSNYIVDGNVGDYWEKAFQKFHPGVKLEYHMLTTRAAIPALTLDVGDLGISRKIKTEELQLFQRYKNHDPLEIIVATGSYNVTGWNPAFGIVVSKDNPLTKITFDQLDGIFGAERLGGWVGTDWHPEFSGAPKKISASGASSASPVSGPTGRSCPTVSTSATVRPARFPTASSRAATNGTSACASTPTTSAIPTRPARRWASARSSAASTTI